MLPSALSLFPGAETAFLGLQKGPPGGEPSIYFNTLPSSLDQRPALVLEPMIASGGSAAKACDLLHIAGAGQVSVVTVLATPDGIARVLQTPAQPHIVTAAIDPELDHIAFIVPGLGDAGDRQFGDM
jgi:uracil phosphoribosyltransferase